MPKIKRELTSELASEWMESPAKQQVHFSKIRSGTQIIEPSPDATGIIGDICSRELLDGVELIGKASIRKDDIHISAIILINPTG